MNLFREYNKKIFNDKYLESEIREIYNNIIEKNNQKILILIMNLKIIS